MPMTRHAPVRWQGIDVRLPLSLFTLCLAGCNLAPRYEAPAPPIYSEYPGQHAGVGQPATAVKWQEFFGDPLLKTYIATALANNRDLAAASAFVAQAEAQFRIQRAAQLPQVDLAASGGKADAGSRRERRCFIGHCRELRRAAVRLRIRTGLLGTRSQPQRIRAPPVSGDGGR